MPGGNRDFVPGKSCPPTHCCHHRECLFEFARITVRLIKDARPRKPQWTESIAVGSGSLVETIAETILPCQSG